MPRRNSDKGGSSRRPKNRDSLLWSRSELVILRGGFVLELGRVSRSPVSESAQSTN